MLKIISISISYKNINNIKYNKCTLSQKNDLLSLNIRSDDTICFLQKKNLDINDLRNRNINDLKNSWSSHNFRRGFKLRFRIRVAYVVSRDVRQTRVFPWTSSPARARRALIDHILVCIWSCCGVFIGTARNRRKRHPDFAPPRINLLNKSGRPAIKPELRAPTRN